jgi:NADPH-dependent 2,4-dienoyl-CoA reductase/sulfur reductase-like enzyme
VTLVDRAAEVGGQLRLAGRAPAHRELWRRWRGNAARQLAHPRIELRLGREAGIGDFAGFDIVVLATGARPFVPDWAGAAVDSWTAIANPAAVAGQVLVADWGGGWEGLDAAEVLAEHGLDVTLACAAPCPGGTLHQYQRNLYLARLDERGVAILHHTEITAGGLRHLFSGRERPLPAAATIVHAHGREPEDELWAALEGEPGRVRAGDVLGPRSAEEATLEGVKALQAARAAVVIRRMSSRAPHEGTRRHSSPRRHTTASSPSRCATPAASVRERTSSLDRMRETWTLAVFSAM